MSFTPTSYQLQAWAWLDSQFKEENLTFTLHDETSPDGLVHNDFLYVTGPSQKFARIGMTLLTTDAQVTEAYANIRSEVLGLPAYTFSVMYKSGSAVLPPPAPPADFFSTVIVADETGRQFRTDTKPDGSFRKMESTFAGWSLLKDWTPKGGA